MTLFYDKEEITVNTISRYCDIPESQIIDMVNKSDKDYIDIGELQNIKIVKNHYERKLQTDKHILLEASKKISRSCTKNKGIRKSRKNIYIPYVFDGIELQKDVEISELYNKYGIDASYIRKKQKNTGFCVSNGFLMCKEDPNETMCSLKYLAYSNKRYFFGPLEQIKENLGIKATASSIRYQIKTNKYYKENKIVITRGEFLKWVREYH